MFTVQLQSFQAGSRLLVYDLSGNLVKSMTAERSTPVDISSQPQGVYILLMKDDAGVRHLARLIKE
jgi:hypothetical protein